MPMRGEIQVSAARPQVSVARPRDPEPSVESAWKWIVATIENPEFLMIALFCTVGLWLTFFLINFFPDFAAISESLQQFP
jgi:hypothetical protein